MSRSERIVFSALMVAAVSLLIVGAVTGLVIRHIVQVLPLLLAAVLAFRRNPASPYAAAPLFVIWGFLMLAIWLFLLGLAHIVTGTFSPAEIVLTITTGGASLIGLGATLICRTPAGWTRRIAVFAVFGLLQVGAIWLSLLPAIRGR